MADIVFIDLEVSQVKEHIKGYGVARAEIPVKSINSIKNSYDGTSIFKFNDICSGAFFVCGHNIVSFDSVHLENEGLDLSDLKMIDTLFMSPLLFPKKPYHRLLKDDKLSPDDENNPLNDAKKCMELYIDEVDSFFGLKQNLKEIFYLLLHEKKGYSGFFESIYYYCENENLKDLIREEFAGKICDNSDLDALINEHPVELAYVLASINADDKDAIIPPWVKVNFPKVSEVFHRLRGKKCEEGCPYCNNAFDIRKHLKDKFGYSEFRTFNGENLQEKAVQAAVDGKSLLAVFPTGGGKSITFQLPALIEADTVRGLTVVISPLVSLMKDQVDNLSEKGFSDAVSLNSLLNPIERKEVLERVESGIASILYIAPESLRSDSVERLLYKRGVSRFVIDEAHCFSSWGQDFRVDYLYIGDFIANLEEKTGRKIPVSCFTATAKQKVIGDIKKYFMDKLGVDLELYTTDTARKNLRYLVEYSDNNEEKYRTLRSWLEAKDCPTIIYVSRTSTAEKLAERLRTDGFNAKPYHGQMDPDEKTENQNAFKRGELNIIVATSAFGMGVDKADVGLVIHYDISNSLEDYVQEAGRAGRDEHISAECRVLFNENDLNKHFMLLNQSKLSISEIQEVWRGVKNLCKGREGISSTALEIAKAAGWNPEFKRDIETRVRAAIAALEMAGYVRRGNNSPRVFADSLKIDSMLEAQKQLMKSPNFKLEMIPIAVLVLRYLIPLKYRNKNKKKFDDFGIDVESRVDYIADHIGIDKKLVIECVNELKYVGILADDTEMYVHLDPGDLSRNGMSKKTSDYLKLEQFLIEEVTSTEIIEKRYDYRELNEKAEDAGLKSSINMLKEIINFWTIKNYIEKPHGEVSNSVLIQPKVDKKKFQKRIDDRLVLCRYIDEYFRLRGRTEYDSVKNGPKTVSNIKVDFSPRDILNIFNISEDKLGIFKFSLGHIEEALLYLTKIGSFKIDGGFLVIYNALRINRIEMDNKKRYKKEDYAKLEEYYKNKTQQIHIVGEYANMMVKDYNAALAFVKDYFNMDYEQFLNIYFAGDRQKEIEKNITPGKYNELFEKLTEKQFEIINDDYSKTIVVAAGPGSGKTMILVNKMASLLQLEDVKSEQLLMLTFSRNAAMEFKRRLYKLIGKAASYVEIKTFHSYAFDLLGRKGTLEKSEDVIRAATDAILNNEVETEKITKTVLMLDEAQDMNSDEYNLVMALRKVNENMRIIAVGDDDQSIYGFRGSDPKYMKKLLQEEDAKLYQMVDNFRNCPLIVNIANLFSYTLPDRLKNEALISKVETEGTVMIARASNPKAHLEGLLEVFFRNCYRKGTRTAILTTTNEQAYKIQYILKDEDYKPRLIQSRSDFSLYNLDEFRTFLEVIYCKDRSVIGETEWKDAREVLTKMHGNSKNFKNVEYILDLYEVTYDKKYYMDFENFLRECSFDDFYRCEEGEIIISTIHKAKGHEFDDVFLVLSGLDNINVEKQRAIYVGMTRAKENLYIVQDGNCFSHGRNTEVDDKELIRSINNAGAKFYNEKKEYPEPKKILMELTLNDVALTFSGKCMDSIRKGAIIAGDKLTIDIKEDNGAFYFKKNINGVDRVVCAASNKFIKEFAQKLREGYYPITITANYIVYWREPDSKTEYRIVLPQILLEKRN